MPHFEEAKKDAAELAAEEDHVCLLSDALKTVAHANPGVLRDIGQQCNFDETSVD